MALQQGVDRNAVRASSNCLTGKLAVGTCSCEGRCCRLLDCRGRADRSVNFVDIGRSNETPEARYLPLSVRRLVNRFGAIGVRRVDLESGCLEDAARWPYRFDTRQQFGMMFIRELRRVRLEIAAQNIGLILVPLCELTRCLADTRINIEAEQLAECGLTVSRVIMEKVGEPALW